MSEHLRPEEEPILDDEEPTSLAPDDSGDLELGPDDADELMPGDGESAGR
jgi:hypothetical protein